MVATYTGVISIYAWSQNVWSSGQGVFSASVVWPRTNTFDWVVRLRCNSKVKYIIFGMVKSLFSMQLAKWSSSVNDGQNFFALILDM